MDKDYNRIILPKSLDKGTSYRTAVWVANSIFTRTGIPVVYGHTDEQKEFKEGDLVILGGVGGHDTGARLHQILNERKIDYFNVEKGYCNWWKPKFWRLTFNENQVTEIKVQWDNKRFTALIDFANNIKFEDGYRYSDYKSGDKIAAAGIAALVAASFGVKGATQVAAVGKGLLKFWWVLLAPFVFIGRLFRKNK